MPLEKLNVANTDTGDEFEVLFNPTEYSIEDSSKWQDQEGNRRRPELQYTGGERRKLSMELFCDTYEAKTDVREHTARFAKLLVVTTNDGNNGKRPPVVELSWGPANADTGFPFVGVLETLKQQFTMFASDGTPVRAKLSVTFKEYRLPVDEQQREPRRGSFPAQTYTVKAGDTLSSISTVVYKDPLKWRQIAEANEIDRPLALEPGQVLVVPAIS